MRRRKMRIVSHSPWESTAAEKPRMRVSRGFTVCNWCERQVETGQLFFIQEQVTSSNRNFYGKLCLTCGKEKRGSIWFEPFICRIRRTNEN